MINVDEQVERNKDIVAAVLSGKSMAQVGRELNLSRQRVEQIFRRDSFLPKNIIPVSVYAKKFKISRTTLIKQIKEQKIEGTRIGNKYYAYVLDIPSNLDKVCKCGKIIVNPRHRFCSRKCMLKEMKEKSNGSDRTK